VKPKQPKTVYLKITDLVIDPQLQMRAQGLNEEHVNDLVEAIKQGKELPKVQVRRIKDRGDFVTDGFHTIEAHGVAGNTKVAVDVKNGTWEDAVLDAALANQEHLGLKRSNKDKRRAVVMLLSVRPNWSGAKIAQELGVSDTLVNDVRKEQSNDDELTDSVSSSSSEEKIIGVNGKHYGPKHQAPRRLKGSTLALSDADAQDPSPPNDGDSKHSPPRSLNGNFHSPESPPRSLENGETLEISASDLINQLERVGGVLANGDHTAHNSHSHSQDAKSNEKTGQSELTAQQLENPEIAAAEVKSALRKLLEVQKTVSAIFRSCHKDHAFETQKELGTDWHDSGEEFKDRKSIYSKSFLRKYESQPLDILVRFLACLKQRIEGRGPRAASDATPWDEADPDSRTENKP
jgi:hypothetical protein